MTEVFTASTPTNTLPQRRGMAFHRLLEVPTPLLVWLDGRPAPDLGEDDSVDRVCRSPWVQRLLAPMGLPGVVQAEVVASVLDILRSPPHRQLLGLADASSTTAAASKSAAGLLVREVEVGFLADIDGEGLLRQRRPDLLLREPTSGQVRRVIDYKWQADRPQWETYGAQLWQYRQMLAGAPSTLPEGFLLLASGEVLRQSDSRAEEFVLSLAINRG